MGAVSWTKLFAAGDDGSDLTGSQLKDIQEDLEAVINGGIENSNVDASAAIEEFKVLFDLDNGHNHDGINSRLLPTTSTTMPHTRVGCAVKRATASTLTVEPGALNIGGTVYVIETASTLDMTSDFVSGSETSDAWFYVYGRINGTSLSFHLSTSPPSLSDTDDNTTEVPFRYDDYSSVYYRLVGMGFNNSSGDIEVDTVHSFDLTPMVMGRITGGATAATDFTVETGWTPKFIHLMSKRTDDSMSDTDQFFWVWVSDHGLSTDSLVFSSDDVTDNSHEWFALTQQGVPNAITVQTTSAAGNFVIDQAGTGAGAREFHWFAWTDLV